MHVKLARVLRGAFATVTLGVLPLRQLPAQAAATACADEPGARGRGVAATVHPEALRARYAAAIVARDWEHAIRGYVGTIDSTVRAVTAVNATPAPTSVAFLEAYRAALAPLADATVDAVRAPRRDWARLLGDAEINQMRPVLDGGRVVVMQRSTGFELEIPVDALRADERDVVCWSAWSLYRLFGTINFETVPAAFARVEATSRRWQRYQQGGPLQLPHELLLNRLARPLVGGGPYDPPRVALAVLHPFAGLELRRSGGGWVQRQGAAVHLAGVTVWLGDWRTHVGASWIAAADGDGVVGQGALVRLGDLVHVGFLDRPVAGGPRQRSALFQLDVLRLIASDARAKQGLAALGISGEIFTQSQAAGRP